uniref:Cytochrome b5 heme-binding domain-containing protein n=1 Tax=Eutreptiella gymnastica TaxID=73025 RepID=A0A7S1I0Z8_9EUGL
MAAVSSTTDVGTAEPLITKEPQPAIIPHTNTEGDLEKRIDQGNAGGRDPWKEPQWKDMKWTVYRGKAYDLQPFYDAHPGGNWLLNLAVRRDCTGLFESYHLRLEVAQKQMGKLPLLEDFPVEAVPKTPYPGDSELYRKIQGRILTELMQRGGKGIQRNGSMDAALTTTGSFFAAAVVYALNPCVATGVLFGLTGAWCGMVTQHPGNHGSLSNWEWVNNILGLMADLVGGSGLCWQYHHNVSHHVHCNDEMMDEDVYSAYPVLRLDDRMPAKWYHKYQHLYMFPAFCFMHMVFFLGDFLAITNKRTEGAAMHGATGLQRGIVVALKVAHLGLLIGLPAYLHGSVAAVLPGALAYSFTWGLSLAILFAVSHNTNAQKDQSLWARGDDWAAQQIVTSADWGGGLACWMTGGLSLQVVHHLFPAISAYHYPAIRNIVEEECGKAGVPYVHYPHLGAILKDFVIFMRDVGRAPDRSSTCPLP